MIFMDIFEGYFLRSLNIVLKDYQGHRSKVLNIFYEGLQILMFKDIF